MTFKQRTRTLSILGLILTGTSLLLYTSSRAPQKTRDTQAQGTRDFGAQGASYINPSDLFVSSETPQPAHQESPKVVKRAQESLRENVAVQDAPVREQRRGTERIPGEVPSVLARSERIPAATARDDQPLTLTLVLRRDDQQGFDEFLRGVQDAQSSTYRQYLNPREQANRFGPSQREYEAVSAWLRREGFELVEDSANRLTLTVRGTRRRAEQAFGVEIGDYRIGEKTFYANDREPSVPAELASHIQAVIGLTDLANLSKPRSQPTKNVQAITGLSDSARPTASFGEAEIKSHCEIYAQNLAQQREFLCRNRAIDIHSEFKRCHNQYYADFGRTYMTCVDDLYAPPYDSAGGGTSGSSSSSSSQESVMQAATSLPAEPAPDVQAVVGLSNPVTPRPSFNEALFHDQCEAVAHLVAPQDPCYQHCVTQAFTPCGLDKGVICSVYLKIAERDLYPKCIANFGKLPADAGNGTGNSTGGSTGSSSASLSRQFETQAATSLRWLDVDGTGQTVGLLEFDTFNINDIKDYLALTGQPATSINHLSKVDVNGGATLGPQEAEVLLDIVAVMTNARGAKVVVYDAPFNGIRTSFQTLFNRMISDNVTVISNSWVYCEDQATLADAQSIDSVLASAAAAGITVLNSTGDFGSTCVDGSSNTISVPADSPHATAVGGTSLTTGPAFTYSSEQFWNGLNDTQPTGAGGFGVSRFFNRPAYQNGFTTSPTRSVPDVSVNGDPAKGIEICQADAGGCPTGAQYGGTSLAAPLWAGFVALLNQAQGQNLGELNPRLYPLGNTNAFHSAASMGSDFQHVGLGSPNLDLISRALTNKAAGAVSATVSEVVADPPGAVADGKAQVFIVVRLRDADGNTVSGKTVTLAANSGTHATITPSSVVSNVSNGAAIFSITDTAPEFVTFTATDTTDGITLQTQVQTVFISPPAAAGGIVATPTTVNANGVDATTITVTLQDAKGNPSPNKIIILSQGNGASIISATTAITDATGKVQFTAVDNKTEAVTYTAVDVTDQDLPVPGSATVNFVNAAGFCAGTNSYRFGTAASGYAVTTFASNFPQDCFTGIGPIGLAFDQNGTLLVGDFQNNNLYAFGQQGGTAGPATLVGTVPGSFGGNLDGLAFTRDGRLYAMLPNGNNLVELNPATAAVIRVVTQFAHSPGALAVDPLSGDLFASGFDGIERVSNFATGPGTVTHYANGNFDGIAFAPDGTLYAAANIQGGIYRVAGTNSQTPGALTPIAFLPGNPDGIAIEPNPANPSRPILYVNRNDGTITRIDTSALPTTPENQCNTGCTDIYTGGSRGDFVTVGPSGCLFATQSDRVIRITKADGTCSLTPTNPSPQIALTPENISPSPAQGTTVTFTAQLKNVTSPEGIPVTLFVSGANPIAKLVRADKNGTAIFTYTGVGTGDDKAFASADLGGGTTIFSNESKVTWTPGKHSTFLTMNLSPSGGIPNKPLTLTATLVDVSASPVVGLGGVNLSFSLAGQTCTGTTDATGTASCSITPSVAAGTYPSRATFAGNSQFLSSSAGKTVDLIDAVPPAVQFSANSYSFKENSGSGAITVTRTGDTSGASTVDYATSDSAGLQPCDQFNGIASQRCDYVISVGTLRFAAGETTKIIFIPLVDDSYAEGPEVFSITLSNPTGATLGLVSTASITITDNDTVTGANPLTQGDFFIRQQYIDFLDREPDPPGFAGWQSILKNCPQSGKDAQGNFCDRIEVSSDFFRSPEFQDRGYFIYRFYSTLARHPFYSEFMPDMAKVSGFLTDQQLEANKAAYVLEFMTRSEFKNKYDGATTPTAYVDALLQTVGLPNHPTRTTWINNLTNGTMTRAEVLRALVESAEVYTKFYNEAFVVMQYFGYLRRDPDALYTHWIDTFNQTGDYRTMINGFMNSNEYAKRFGP